MRDNTEVRSTLIKTIPAKRLFGTQAAARYLGMHEQTLRKVTDEGLLPARQLGARRMYVLEDLESFVDRLPSYDRGAVPGQKGSAHGS